LTRNAHVQFDPSKRKEIAVAIDRGQLKEKHMSNLTHTETKPWYRHRWPWFIMLGPFLAIVAGSYTGWLAFTHQDPLVVGDYYKRGKAINQDLSRDRAASALGLAATLRYDAQRAVIEGTIRSHGNAHPEALLLHLAHATLPEKDIKLTLKPDADGAFSAPLAMLERTRWQVTISNAKGDWKLDATWQWPAQRDIEILADAAP
jgi:hypothetical protein